MPHLTDPDELLAHARAAVNDRTHWVFISDHPRGKSMLTLFGMYLVGYHGVPESEIGYAEFGFLFAPVNRRLDVMLLTVRKGAVEFKVISTFLTLLGHPSASEADDRDLIPLSADPEAAAAVLQQFRDGKCRVAADPSAN